MTSKTIVNGNLYGICFSIFPTKKIPQRIFIILVSCGLIYFILYACITNEKITFINSVYIVQTYVSTKGTHHLSSTPETSSSRIISLRKNSESKRQTIFFMETSGKPNLNGRQACAVESTAKQNPNMDVVIYFISPTLNLSDSRISILTEIPNIRFQYLHLNSFFSNTPLREWYQSGKWKKSPHKISHMSDALRFLILWKFGGIYLDLDVVVMKSLQDLKNCAGKESDFNVAAGVLAFDQFHFFLLKCLQEFAVSYRGKNWGYNGPELITRVFRNVCHGIKDISEISREKCEGVTALDTDAFYPVPWRDWKKFFDRENAGRVITSWNRSYLIHVWNKHSINTPIEVGQPYDQIAKKYCPLIYEVNSKDGWS